MLDHSTSKMPAGTKPRLHRRFSALPNQAPLDSILPVIKIVGAVGLDPLDCRLEPPGGSDGYALRMLSTL
jgi:hypothetical protein